MKEEEKYIELASNYFSEEPVQEEPGEQSGQSDSDEFFDANDEFESASSEKDEETKETMVPEAEGCQLVQSEIA